MIIYNILALFVVLFCLFCISVYLYSHAIHHELYVALLWFACLLNLVLLAIKCSKQQVSGKYHTHHCCIILSKINSSKLCLVLGFKHQLTSSRTAQWSTQPQDTHWISSGQGTVTALTGGAHGWQTQRWTEVCASLGEGVCTQTTCLDPLGLCSDTNLTCTIWHGSLGEMPSTSRALSYKTARLMRI